MKNILLTFAIIFAFNIHADSDANKANVAKMYDIFQNGTHEEFINHYSKLMSEDFERWNGRYVGLGFRVNEEDMTVMSTNSSPAKDHFMPGDKFISVNGVKADSGEDLPFKGAVGGEVKVVLERDGKKVKVKMNRAVQTNTATKAQMLQGTGWWEVQWASKELADQAWSEWVQNKEANEWNEKYASVLQCDGEARNGFNSVFPIASSQYSELPGSGYFYSEVHLCEFNDGSTQEEAIAFLSGFTEAVSNADYSDTSYHLGNYFYTDDTNGFLWANFTNSEASMNKANISFEESVRESMFPIFSEFASCGDVPDLYHGYTLYNAENKEFMPTFMSN